MNYELYKWIHGFSGHSQMLDNFMIFCTKGAIVILALMLLFIWVAGKTKHRKSVLYAGIGGVIGIIVNILISHIYYEPRPFVTHNVQPLISHAADASFPSDHTTGAFSIAFILWLRHRRIGTVAIIFAALVGLSRVWVGVHYPFDVLGSIIVSIILAIVVMKSSKLLDPIIRKIVFIYERIVGVKKGTSGHNM
ncbi:undecaprenyl-diphosphatase [Priestia koreensis]|uniref:undecaprenyl-diphosphatase n=1 Tax=Priestia koreensis TaxID=284581 RepID=UPI001F5A7B15|nr:undecaprenyl-diphosphatase [Priestia koreensis]UNL83744.1 undecaprenyl-diphosphatase [Priestia koreensis]